MSTIGHPLARARLACVFAASTFSVFAQATPRHDAAPFSNESSGLRCHYRPIAQADGVATEFVMAQNFSMQGYWRSSSFLPSRSLFYTDASPADLRDACARTLQRTPGAGALVATTAAASAQSYNYEVWHNGSLSPGAEVERIVSFGDSLSDTGNVHNESQWKLAGSSWFLGRFSNGPVWVDHLSRRTGLPLNNWSVGGAQSTDVYYGLIRGVESQVDSFIDYASAARDYDPSRTLFTFLAGGNDFVNDTRTAPSVVAAQEKALQKLVDFGARKILVVNLPDVSQAPVFRLGRDDAHTVLGKVEYYNHHMAIAAQRIAALSGATIRVVDARGNFDDLLANPARAGFVNATESCLDISSSSSLNYVRTHPLRARCDPARYVFWDTLHPTSRVHELMAEWALQYTPAAWGLR